MLCGESGERWHAASMVSARCTITRLISRRNCSLQAPSGPTTGNARLGSPSAVSKCNMLTCASCAACHAWEQYWEYEAALCGKQLTSNPFANFAWLQFPRWNAGCNAVRMIPTPSALLPCLKPERLPCVAKCDRPYLSSPREVKAGLNDARHLAGSNNIFASWRSQNDAQCLYDHALSRPCGKTPADQVQPRLIDSQSSCEIKQEPKRTRQSARSFN